jgi:hypothetical protein
VCVCGECVCVIITYVSFYFFKTRFAIVIISVFNF